MRIPNLSALSAATIFAFAATSVSGPLVAAARDYAVAGRWKLGGPGGWDILVADSAVKRLYVTRGDRVVVVDTESGKNVGEIPHTDGVHGVALAHQFGRGYTSNGKANSVTVFDLKTLKALQEIKIEGQNPDLILYDEPSKQVFVFNGRSANASVIDAKSGTVAGTIPLGGKPEFAVSDEHGRVFVNIEDKGELVAIDAKTRKVDATWPLEECEEPTGLAIDIAHHRLFSACANERMAVTDSTNGRQIASVPIGKGPDGAAFDPQLGLAFTSNGADGTLTVVHEDDPDHYSVVQTLATQKSARTLALDPKTHWIYLAAAEFGTAPAPTTEQPRPRPPMVPDSFVILVAGK
jgi:DNA-binding beta-propeller fold protein YncE